MPSPITLFTLPGCTDCIRTRAAFAAHGITPREVDLRTAPAELERLKALGFRAAPVVESAVGDVRRWSGFAPDYIAGAVRAITEAGTDTPGV